MGKIVVIGSTGMLGNAVAQTKFSDRALIEVSRQGNLIYSKNQYFQTDSKLSNFEELLKNEQVEYVINCAGLIRQKINEEDPSSINEAVNANVKLPLHLVNLSEKYNFKILQIGTDCVFSGTRGMYVENDMHDAIDIYGKTKSLGEIPHTNLAIVRCSIIGLEAKTDKSLLSWLLAKNHGDTITGYSDQLWNGITVWHFAKILAGIIASDDFHAFSGVHHLVPADFVTKGELLALFAKYFDRHDLVIHQSASGQPLDMRLNSNYENLNSRMWNLAGYAKPQSIEEMVVEYSDVTKNGG